MKQVKNNQITKLTTAIVDDDKIHQFVMEKLLKSVGFADQPVICSNGQEFISWLEQEILPRPSGQHNVFIFLDIQMPCVDGWEVLDYLRDSIMHNCIFVAIVTASLNPSYRERALSYPMVIDFKVKPILNDYIAMLKESPTGRILFKP